MSFAISRQGCKQPFHRLFGRLIVLKIFFMSRLPTRSNPAIKLYNRKKVASRSACDLLVVYPTGFEPATVRIGI